MRLQRPREPSDFWRAWVNAVDNFSTTFSQAFRISQDRGEGMIIHGGRQWRDYRVETALTAHLAEHMGGGVRVQGLRRFYAVLLERPDKLLLARVRDGETTLLAETAFHWSFEKPHQFVVEADGRRILAAVDGVRLAARDDSDEALTDGGPQSLFRGEPSPRMRWSLPRPRGRRSTRREERDRGELLSRKLINAEVRILESLWV